MRCEALCTVACNTELQLGLLLVEGSKIGLPLEGDSFYHFFVSNFDSADTKLLTRSVQRYELWRFAQKYDIERTSIECVSSEHIEALSTLKSSVASQYKDIVQTKSVTMADT